MMEAIKPKAQATRYLHGDEPPRNIEGSPKLWDKLIKRLPGNEHIECHHEPTYSFEKVGDLFANNFAAGCQTCKKCGEGFEMSLKEFEEYNKVFRAHEIMKCMLKLPYYAKEEE